MSGQAGFKNTVSVQGLAGKGQNLKTYASNMSSVLNSFSANINSVSNSWTSNAQSNFKQQFETLKAKFPSFYNLVNEFGDRLVKTSQAYQNFDTFTDKDYGNVAK